MFAKFSPDWRVARFALRTLLIATLWLCSLLATYHYSFEAGHQAEFNQRLSAEYPQKYAVGDLLNRHSPEQLTARIQAISPISWAERGGPGSMSYFDTNRSLVVHHSGAIHDEVENLLAELRSE